MPGRRHKHARAFGFTLVELMVVLVILAVLAALSYPMYGSHVTKTRRTAAMSALSVCSARLERYRSDNGTYVGATVGQTAASTCSSHAPTDVPFARRTYDVTFVATPTAANYVLAAAPRAGGPQAGDGFLRLDMTGLRFWDANNDGDALDAGEAGWDG